MKSNVARTISAAGMLLATAALGMIDDHGTRSAKIMPPPGCGFIALPQAVGELTARYFHCGNSFILIKFHWSTGTTGTACVPPHGQIPFYKD
ncbi:DUF6355 family natural product biosynthesis protein, partial [Lentzea sp. NBRC 102530]|uniref:DUF6355 family natural product biosynthesis protein n=1 Tax=Lentzea sp. NBRC 102530 TaxID=3032201 RepID=UPI002557C186